jgi:hypothetical protein
VEVFALAWTLLILLPTALWVTSIIDGRAGVRALFARVFRWRFGVNWWLVLLFGLPVIALLLCLLFGGSLHAADLGHVLIKQLGSILLAVAVINLWRKLCGPVFSKPAWGPAPLPQDGLFVGNGHWSRGRTWPRS